MEKTEVTINNQPLVRIGCDDSHILHRVGSDDYTEIRHATVPARDVDNWEEIALADIPSYSKAEYDAEVERLIALRYSHGKEVEINRECDTKPGRFAEYLDYIEQCKAEARVTLESKGRANVEPDTEEI